jgi:hypothetical protein
MLRLFSRRARWSVASCTLVILLSLMSSCATEPSSRAVYPAEAYGLFNCIVIWDSGFVGVFLIVDQPDFFLAAVVFLQPSAPVISIGHV